MSCRDFCPCLGKISTTSGHFVLQVNCNKEIQPSEMLHIRHSILSFLMHVTESSNEYGWQLNHLPNLKTCPKQFLSYCPSSAKFISVFSYQKSTEKVMKQKSVSLFSIKRRYPVVVRVNSRHSFLENSFGRDEDFTAEHKLVLKSIISTVRLSYSY